VATKYPIRIKAAPKVGNIYWCDFHPEGVIHIPEFWKNAARRCREQERHLAR